ncbi:MAG TPA: preprotein translocase subunit SecG [Candidatus Omnitrophota bacterium]|nr:preprotein translocase subunit SecG [Candidatus Omnitrophota bacterium]
MFAFIITIHVITCALLILIVLVQQGRGGGLVDSLSSAESIFGTKTNAFLIKSTSVLAVVFFITCLALAFLSIQKNKSLIETSYKPQAATETKAMDTKKQGASTEAVKTQTSAETKQQTAAPADPTNKPLEVPKETASKPPVNQTQ